MKYFSAEHYLAL